MKPYKNHNNVVENIKTMLAATFTKIAEFDDEGLLRTAYVDSNDSTIIETKETSVRNPYTKETWYDITVETCNIVHTDFFEDFEKSVKNPDNIDRCHSITPEGYKWMPVNFPMLSKNIINAMDNRITD